MDGIASNSFASGQARCDENRAIRNSEVIKHMLNAYLRWYRDVRIKGDLDYRSPMQYRRDLGLLAA